MNRVLLTAAAVAALAGSVAAQTSPDLSGAFAQAQKSATAARTQQLTLVYEMDRWRVLEHGGFNVDIKLAQGDRAVLTLEVWLGDNHGNRASFDVDGIDAVVDGMPGFGIHVMPRQAGSSRVEIDAVRPGIYSIYNPWTGMHYGQITITAK